MGKKSYCPLLESGLSFGRAWGPIVYIRAVICWLSSSLFMLSLSKLVLPHAEYSLTSYPSFYDCHVNGGSWTSSNLYFYNAIKVMKTHFNKSEMILFYPQYAWVLGCFSCENKIPFKETGGQFSEKLSLSIPIKFFELQALSGWWSVPLCGCLNYKPLRSSADLQKVVSAIISFFS